MKLRHIGSFIRLDCAYELPNRRCAFYAQKIYKEKDWQFRVPDSENFEIRVTDEQIDEIMNIIKKIYEKISQGAISRREGRPQEVVEINDIIRLNIAASGGKTIPLPIERGKKKREYSKGIILTYLIKKNGSTNMFGIRLSDVEKALKDYFK